MLRCSILWSSPGQWNMLLGSHRSDHKSHYGDVIMGAIASQITSHTIVYSTVYSDADQRKHQSSASLAFVRGIHRGPVNSPHKWPVTRKMFPFDNVIMYHAAKPFHSACNPFEDQLPLDQIYTYLIFKWVAMLWLKLRSTEPHTQWWPSGRHGSLLTSPTVILLTATHVTSNSDYKKNRKRSCNKIKRR